ncbi:DNA primase [candidate division WWE3 bacterium]|nr:DNA primase [candidate division WWE3 bacterium]
MSDVAKQIKERIDIVEYINRTTKLQRTGKNFKGICPFHKEVTGSFFVSPDRQMWHCFGCNRGGDLFTFVTEKEGIDFKSVLELLAPEAGVDLSQFRQGDLANEHKAYDALQAVTHFYQHALFEPKAKSALEYILTQRQIPRELIERFQIGYAPDSWSITGEYLITKGFKVSELIASGIIIEKPDSDQRRNWYDRFRNRIMFPIHDRLGRVVGFTARSLEAKPTGGKYINTPETEYYKKSSLLYGLELAKDSIKRLDYTIVTEGTLDVIAFHKIGIQNVVAPLGTALTMQHIEILKRISSRIVLFFDADQAGYQATLRALLSCLASEMEVKVAIIEGGKDPDELVKSKPNQLKSCLQSAKSFYDFLLIKAKEQLPNTHPNFAVHTSQLILPFIKIVPNTIHQESLIQRLSRDVNITINSLTQQLSKINPNDIVNTVDRISTTSVQSTPIRPPKQTRLQALWRELNAMMLQIPASLENDAQLMEIVSEIPEPDTEHIVTSLNQKLKQFIAETGTINHEELDKQLTPEELELTNLLALHNLGTISADEEAFLSNLSQITRDIIISQTKRRITQVSKIIAAGDSSAELLNEMRGLTHKLREQQLASQQATEG